MIGSSSEAKIKAHALVAPKFKLMSEVDDRVVWIDKATDWIPVSWVIVNTGTQDWPGGGKLTVVCGDMHNQLQEVSKPLIKSVKSGETTKLNAMLQVSGNKTYNIQFHFQIEQNGGTHSSAKCLIANL